MICQVELLYYNFGVHNDRNNFAAKLKEAKKSLSIAKMELKESTQLKNTMIDSLAQNVKFLEGYIKVAITNYYLHNY